MVEVQQIIEKEKKGSKQVTEKTDISTVLYT